MVEKKSHKKRSKKRSNASAKKEKADTDVQADDNVVEDDTEDSQQKDKPSDSSKKPLAVDITPDDKDKQGRRKDKQPIKQGDAPKDDEDDDNNDDDDNDKSNRKKSSKKKSRSSSGKDKVTPIKADKAKKAQTPERDEPAGVSLFSPRVVNDKVKITIFFFFF